MATLAIPGSANFVGEFFILTGAFESKIALALIASVGIALAAFYALRMYQRTMHNRLPDGLDVARDRACARPWSWCRWSPASWRSPSTRA